MRAAAICYYDHMRHIPVAELRRLPQPLRFLEESNAPTPEAIRRELYQPPVLAVLEGERSLIWGVETLRRADSAGVSELWCREFPELNRLEAAGASLAAENRPGRWELRELAGLVSYLRKDTDVLEESLRELIDGPKRGLLDQARKAAALDEPIRGMVLSGALTLRHGEELSELPNSLVEAVAEALDTGSFSTRREIVQMSVELYKRHAEEHPEMEATIRGALGSRDPRGELYTLRYPSYTAAREELDRFRNRQLKGSGVRLEEPPNFEGDSFSFVIPFSTPEELERRLESARRAASEIGTITELLG